MRVGNQKKIVKDSFGQHLRSIRKAANLNIGELARRLNVSITYLSDIELDRRLPLSTEKIFIVAETVQINPDTLLILAAQQRGSIELPICKNYRAQLIGIMLMRNWEEFSNEDFQKLEKFVQTLVKEKMRKRSRQM